MAENNIILEDGANRAATVRHFLPAQTVAEKAADFCLGERGGDDWSPSGCIDPSYAFERNANAGKFCPDVSEPIGRPVKINHQTLHCRPRSKKAIRDLYFVSSLSAGSSPAVIVAFRGFYTSAPKWAA